MKATAVFRDQSQTSNDIFAGLPKDENPSYGYRIENGDVIGIRGNIEISDLRVAQNGNLYVNITYKGEKGAYKKNDAGEQVDIKGVGSIVAPTFITYEDRLTGTKGWNYRGQASIDSLLIGLNGKFGGKCAITVQRTKEDNVKSSRYFFEGKEISYKDLITGCDPGTGVAYLDFIRGALRGQTFTNVLKKDNGYFVCQRTHRWADADDLAEIHAQKRDRIAGLF